MNITSDQLEKLFSQAPGMIYIFVRKPDGSYYIPFSSSKIKENFGCNPEDVADDFSPILKVIFEDDKQKVIESVEESAKTMKPWHCEYRVQLPGQDIKWMFGSSVPEKMEDGSIAWYGFNTDITDKKYQEEELMKKNTDLQKMNSYMTDREVRMAELKKQMETIKSQ